MLKIAECSIEQLVLQQDSQFMQQVRVKERIQKVKMMIASQTKRRIEILRYILIIGKEDYPIQGLNLVLCHHKMFMLMITPKNFITSSMDKARMNKLSKE